MAKEGMKQQQRGILKKKKRREGKGEKKSKAGKKTL
jgi:hypothetical protein